MGTSMQSRPLRFSLSGGCRLSRSWVLHFLRTEAKRAPTSNIEGLNMANWQEALKKGGQAFHGEPGKPADASVNMHKGHYVAYAANNSINAGWDENLSSAGATSA